MPQKQPFFKAALMDFWPLTLKQADKHTPLTFKVVMANGLAEKFCLFALFSNIITALEGDWMKDVQYSLSF